MNGLSEAEMDTLISMLPVRHGSTRADRAREAAPAVEAIVAARRRGPGLKVARSQMLSRRWDAHHTAVVRWHEAPR